MRSVSIIIDSRINNTNITYCLTFKEKNEIINVIVCNKETAMEWTEKWLTNQIQGEDLLFIPFDR